MNETMNDIKPMRIEGIEIRNYRLFRHVSLNKLPPMTVVVGATVQESRLSLMSLHS